MDFVELVLARQTDRFELINLGCGSSVAIGDLVKKIILFSGRPLSVRFDTSKPAINFNISLNIDKARSKYGWAPKVSLDEGIQKTLAWHRAAFPTGAPT